MVQVIMAITIGVGIIITTIITMEEEEVHPMHILQMVIDMVLEMVLEIQVMLTQEEVATLTQHLVIEIPIIITQELLQTILLETILIIQQDLTLLRNQQEVVAMNLLQYVPTLQVLIPDLHHHPHLMEVEVMVVEAVAEVEDHHLAEVEDKK